MKKLTKKGEGACNALLDKANEAKRGVVASAIAKKVANVR